jgi:hypothetical protein
MSQHRGLTFADDKRLALLGRSHQDGHGHPPIGLAVSIDRDLSPVWNRLISSLDVDLGPAFFRNGSAAPVAHIETDQPPAALGGVGLRGAARHRAIDDQLGGGEELSQSCVSPEDAADSTGERQLLAAPPDLLQACGGLGQRPVVTSAGAAGGDGIDLALVRNRGGRTLYRLLLITDANTTHADKIDGLSSAIIISR